MSQVKPYWVAGKPRTSPAVHEVRSPFDGHMVDRHALPTPEDVDEAVAAAVDVQPQALATTAAQRADALMHVSQQIAARADEIAHLITAENGKPLMWS
ncbi:MAG: aldehyde dehydrogenase family protein, partial [Candidatus Nanopelagicales bacterium]